MKRRLQGVRPHFVKVLAKSFDLLEAMAESKTGISVSQLSRIVGQPKPSVFRILYTLRELGYVEQEADSQCYALSERLRSFSSGTAFEALKQIARPYMESLVARFEQTVSLGVHRHGQVLYLEIVEGLRSIRMSAVVSSYAPIHSTALGKAILAFISRDGAKHLLGKHALSKFTPKTMTNVQTLLKHLNRVAHQGYAVDDQETETGARCVAAPIFNVEAKPFAAISISGPVSHIQGERILEIAEALKTACQKISAQVGFSLPEVKVRGAGLNWFPQLGKRLP